MGKKQPQGTGWVDVQFEEHIQLLWTKGHCFLGLYCESGGRTNGVYLLPAQARRLAAALLKFVGDK